MLFEKEIPYGPHDLRIQWSGRWHKGAKKTSTAINIDTLIVDPSKPKPLAPVNLQTISYMEGILLSFDNSTQEFVESYNIYRSSDGQNFRLLANIGKPYEDSTVYYLDYWLDDSDYYYAVTAVSSYGKESDYSNIVMARTLVPNSEYVIEDTSNHVDYTGDWDVETDDDYSGGTRHVTLEAGAQATIPFTGYATKLVLHSGPDMGMVRIYWPHGGYSEYDLYDPYTGTWSFYTDSSGRHIGEGWVIECLSGKVNFDCSEIKDIDLDPPGAPAGLTGEKSEAGVELSWPDNPEPDVAK